MFVSHKKMASAITLQFLLMCMASVCWGNSCSDGSSCGIDLSTTNLDEAIARIMSQVRSVLPESDSSTEPDCQSKCIGNEVDDEAGRTNTSSIVDDLIQGINGLIAEMEKDLNKITTEDDLKNNVKDFTKDRDWPKLKKKLEETLDPTDPALVQIRGNTWDDGKDAVIAAVYEGSTELLEKLLDLGLDANVPWGVNNSTMLHAIASTGNKELADLMFSRGAAIDGRAEWDVTPLHRAAASHQPGMVKWLVDHGANVNATDSRGWTPLHFAAIEGDLEAVKVLVGAGAYKEAINQDGLTARDEADDKGHHHVSTFLAPASAF